MLLFFTTLSIIACQNPVTWNVTNRTGSATASTFPAIHLDDLVSIQRTAQPIPAWPTEPHIILANGDRIVGKVTAIDERTLSLESSLLGKIRLPLMAISTIWRTNLPGDTPLDPMASDWLAERKSDLILLSNGDVLRGTIDRFGDDLAVWLKQTGASSRKIEINKVVAVSFSAGLSRVKTPKVSHFHAVLVDGSRLTLDALVSQKKTLGMSSVAGFNSFVAESDLVSLNIIGGKATYLADLKAKRTVIEPYQTLSFPPQANRSAKGNPLRIETKYGISTYDRGLGTHSKSTIDYELNGKYKRFEAFLGLDATTGKHGRVTVKILVDGQLQKIEGLKDLTAETGPTAVSLDLSKAKTFSIAVDGGIHGDANADVNWCDARFVE